MNKEVEGWEMEGRPELLPCVDDDIDEYSDERLGPLEAAVSFHSETMHRVSVSSSCSSPKRESLSKVKKTSAFLKRAMHEKSKRWQLEEWCGKTKSHKRQPAGKKVDNARMINGEVQKKA